MHVFDRAAQLSRKAVEGLRVRSALNPLLWLCGIATPVCVAGAYFFGGVPWIQGLLAIIAVLPILTACGAYIYFAHVKPDKLQSEDYQLRHETLQIIQLRANLGALDPGVLERIAAAPHPQLPAPHPDAE